MSSAEQRIYHQMLNLFADVKEQRAAFYERPCSSGDIQRMKIQWHASSEANKKSSRDTTRENARKK